MAVTPVIIQDDAGRLYAIGLEWKRIVVSGAGAAAEQSGYEFAHKAGSNRLTFTKDPRRGDVTGVGHAKFAKSDFDALSLAQAFALRHDPKDRAVVALRLDPGQVWVCAISEGMVVNGYDFVASEEEARERIRELAKRFPEGALAHWGDLLADAQIITLDELQETAVQHASDCRVVPTRKNQDALRKMLSILAALLLILGAKYGWEHYKQYKAREAARIASEAAAPRINAQEAWNQGLAAWVEKSSQGTPVALRQLLVGLSALPVNVAGWDLKMVECSRNGVRWGCVGSFERATATRTTTEQFLRSLPTGWEADWGGLNKASARFGFDADAHKVVIPSLRDSKETLLPLLAHLQANSRAFEKLDIGPAAVVPVELPKNPDGSVVVIDPSTVKPIVVSMELTISGPLRSYYKLVDQQISWRVLKMSISNNVTADSPEKSMLQVTEAKGDVYAIK